MSKSKKRKRRVFNNLLKLLGVLTAFAAFAIFIVKFYSDTPCIKFYERYVANYSSKYLNNIAGYSPRDYNFLSDTIAINLEDTVSTKITSDKINATLFSNLLPELERILLPEVDIDALLEEIGTGPLVNDSSYTSLIVRPNNFYYKVKDICEIKVGLDLITPKKVSLIIPLELKDFLYASIAECEEFKKSSLDINSPVDIVSILDCLMNNPSFQVGLSRLLDKYRSYTRIVNLGIYDAEFFFQKGEYILPGIYKTIIDAIIEKYVIQISQSAGGKKYIILCRGYADTSGIGRNGIVYGNRGGYAASGTRLLQTDNSNPIGPFIKDNLQLSYARAFEGILYVKESFSLPLGEDEYNVSFMYAGEGELLGKSLSKSRKITFELLLDTDR